MLIFPASKSLIYTYQDEFISWLCVNLTEFKWEERGALCRIHVSGDQAKQFSILHFGVKGSAYTDRV